MDNDQNKKGINPINSPIQKNLLNIRFFFLYKYGRSDSKGTITKKVFIINDKPIQTPKRKIYNLSSFLFILTKENTPIVTKHE